MNAPSANVSRGSGPSANQIANVATAMARTSGTKTSLMRSARRWIGALLPWARRTSSTIRASAVSGPTRVARKMNVPVRFRVAPITSSPVVTSTGIGSPVSIEVVDRRAPLDDEPVDRDLLARPDAEQVARADLPEVDVDLLVAADDPGRLRTEPDEASDRAGRRVPSPAPRATARAGRGR